MWSHELCPEYWTNTLTYFRYITIKDFKDTFLNSEIFLWKWLYHWKNWANWQESKSYFYVYGKDDELSMMKIFGFENCFFLYYFLAASILRVFFLLNSEKCLVIEPTFERKAKTIITQRWLLRTTTILVSNSHVRKITIIFSEQKHSSFFTFFENFTPKNSSKLDIFCCKK